MKIYFHTETYPFGLGESWKTQELRQLIKHFDQVVVVPYQNFEATTMAVNPINKVKYCSPLFKKKTNPSWVSVMIMILKSPIVIGSEFVTALKHGKNGLSCFKKSVSKIRRLLRHHDFEKMLNERNVLHYFFWGRHSIEAIALESKCNYVVRLHGYDLYKERNISGYIPFQYRILENSRLILAISTQGCKYIERVWRISAEKIFLSRLGTESAGSSRMSEDNVLRIYSCSSIIKVKRLDRLIDSLLKIKSLKVVWSHIGDGPLRQEMEKRSNHLSKNIEAQFLGQMKPKEVMQHYNNRKIDLFVNSSESEGVPVSIMEAMAMGIPVIAPDIGGVSEIVNSHNGFCVSSDNYIVNCANAIVNFYKLSNSEKLKMRESARATYLEKYHAPTNAEVLSKKLSIL